MSDPLRLRDEGAGDVRAMLRGAPRTSRMSTEDKARTRARLAPLAGIAAGAGALAWLEGAAIGAGLGVLVMGASAFVPGRAARAPADAPRAALPSAPASASIPAAVTASARIEATPAETTSATIDAPVTRPSALRTPAPAPKPTAEPAAPIAPKDTLVEEAALLEQARAALGGNAANALALTETHAARFPAGKLSMEREFLAIDALRRLGRTSEARARGEALVARARGGLYEPRLQRLLDGLR